MIPRAEIAAAYERLGAGPVAVRSSATAEDLPDASFAGQHDTVPRRHRHRRAARGDREMLGFAGRRPGGRPTGRRAGSTETVRMAVVVQRMVDAATAGVLFTANPLTGRRTEMLVDAARGLGTTVVDGAAAVDHYVLDGVGAGRSRLPDPRHSWPSCGPPGSGCKPPSAARRTWSGRSTPTASCGCCSRGRSPRSSRCRRRPATCAVYLEFGHVQGMLQPVTPMGMSTLKTVVAMSRRSASGWRSSTSAAGCTAT